MINEFLIMAIADRDVKRAINGWLAGSPIEEMAFQNRLVELIRSHQHCNVGTQAPVRLYIDVINLHRQGPNQTDAFGSDLAFTLYIRPTGFLKTAMFQLKRSADFKATFFRKQLNDALRTPWTADRSFVAGIDELRRDARVGITKSVLGAFAPSGKQKTLTLVDWPTVPVWLWKWLNCEIGERSTPGSLASIEAVLAEYAPTQIGRREWLSSDIVAFADSTDRGPRLTPAKTWVIAELVDTGEIIPPEA
jgi:hypothetical protein